MQGSIYGGLTTGLFSAGQSIVATGLTAATKAVAAAAIGVGAAIIGGLYVNAVRGRAWTLLVD
jgi:hypothetical protein